MGGCTFVLKGETKTEVRRKVSKCLKDARHHGLYEDRRSPITFNEAEGKFVSLLRIHT